MRTIKNTGQKVSIVIPVYNVAEYVSDCLRTVLNQTYRNIEIIIVNDCTKDNSMQVIEDVLKREKTDLEIRIVNHSHNSGLSAARNTGIRESTGDFLYFLDSDDEITPDCIEKLVARQEETQAEIVVGGYEIINAKDDYQYPSLNPKSFCIKNKSDILKEYMRGHIYVMAWNKLVCKKFLTAYELYFKDGLVHEDDLWSFRCACCMKSIAIVKDKTYIYKIRSGSIMDAVLFEKEIEWRIIIIEDMLKCVSENRLGTNRHVFSRLQEEKLSILYKCRKMGYREIAKTWYNKCPDVRTVSLGKILIWYFFNTKKMKRDAHYFLSEPTNEEYYWNMPNYVWDKRNKNGKFYLWFIKVLFFRILHLNATTGLPFYGTRKKKTDNRNRLKKILIMPHVSVIIPVYNAEQYIGKCIRSILRQTFQDFEIILVDDGSTDNSYRIMEEHLREDKRVTLLRQPNRGVSAARNKGLDNARGEWVYFCDADDELYENALEILAERASGKEVCFVMAGYEVCNEDGRIVYSRPEREDMRLSIDQCIENMFHPWFYRYQGYLWTKLFKREHIDRLHLRFNEGIYFNEDRLFCVQYLCGSEGCGVYTTIPVYKYYERKGSAMASLKVSFNYRFVTDIDAFAVMLTTIRTAGKPTKLIRLCRKGLLYSVDTIMNMIDDYGVSDESLVNKLRYAEFHYIGIKNLTAQRLKKPKHIIKLARELAWRLSHPHLYKYRF